MTEEIDDEILESELLDDALEKRIRKLEAEACRILRQSNELIKEMNRARANQQEAPAAESRVDKNERS